MFFIQILNWNVFVETVFENGNVCYKIVFKNVLKQKSTFIKNRLLLDLKKTTYTLKYRSIEINILEIFFSESNHYHLEVKESTNNHDYLIFSTLGESQAPRDENNNIWERVGGPESVETKIQNYNLAQLLKYLKITISDEHSIAGYFPVFL